MPSISLIKDPLSGEAEIYSTDNVNLMAWIVRELPWVGSAGAVIVLNGNIIADSTKHADMAERCSVELSGDDVVQIYSRPEGVEIAYQVVIAIVVALVAYAVMPKPRIPNNAGETNSSPNNQLNAATNEFRPRQAIPDISGEIIAYPDFIQRSYYEYDSAGRRIFTEWFCFGIGQYELIDGVFEDKTPFDSSGGYSYTVYGPGEQPATLLDVRRNQSSNSIDLLSNDQQTRTVFVESGAVNSSTGGILLTEQQITDLELTPGDTVSINIGVKDSFDLTFTISGNYTIDTVSSNSFTVLANDWIDSGTIENGTISNLEFVVDNPWFVLSGDAIEEVRFHLVMPLGIRKGDGTDATVNVGCYVELLDSSGNPTGTTYQKTASFFGNTQTQQAITFRFNSADGLLPGRYRARAARTTPYLGDNSLDLVTLDGIDSVTSYSTANFGNVTTLETKRRSGQRSASSSTRISAKICRKLELFNPANGTFANGVFTATRSCAQYAMYLLRKKANVKLRDINYARLFALEPAGELGYFDFSFDDKNVGLRDRLEAVLNVARMKYYNIGNRFDFVRDEPRAVRQALFNRRNMTGELELSRVGVRTNDFDSVSVRYVDPDSNEERFVHRRINPATGAIENGEGDRPDKMDLAGCRSLTNATNRAELEIRRKKYIQWSGKCNALGDALTIGPLDRIGVADINDSETFDGEIISIEGGGLYRTSEPFEPTVGVSYVIEITGQDGLMGAAVPVTAHPSTKFGFSAPALAGAYVSDGYTVSMGARYLISSDSTFASTDFSLVKRGRPTGSPATVPIEFVQYDARIYEMD